MGARTRGFALIKCATRDFIRRLLKKKRIRHKKMRYARFFIGRGFKNLVPPPFQIGQHAKNTYVLVAISKFLSSLSSEFKFSTFSEKLSLKENSTLNKRTNVLVISYSNIDSLHDILAHCLIQFPFQTRKGIDFYYWCIVLYMHKFCYIYLTRPLFFY